jgi:hypothetical protein
MLRALYGAAHRLSFKANARRAPIRASQVGPPARTPSAASGRAVVIGAIAGFPDAPERHAERLCRPWTAGLSPASDGRRGPRSAAFERRLVRHAADREWPPGHHLSEPLAFGWFENVQPLRQFNGYFTG